MLDENRSTHFTTKERNSLFIIGLFYATLTFALGVTLTWWEFGVEFYNNGYVRGQSRMRWRDLNRQIEKYVIAKGYAPESLAELQAEKYNLGEVEIHDAYGHMFRYEPAGTSWTLTDLGRDGAVGGRGYDADTSDDAPLEDIDYTDPVNKIQPTFWHFWFEMPSGKALFVNVIVALVAFRFCYRVLGRCFHAHDSSKARNSLSAEVQLAVMMLFYVFIVHVLSQFTIPSGH